MHKEIYKHSYTVYYEMLSNEFALAPSTKKLDVVRMMEIDFQIFQKNNFWQHLTSA